MLITLPQCRLILSAMSRARAIGLWSNGSGMDVWQNELAARLGAVHWNDWNTTHDMCRNDLNNLNYLFSHICQGGHENARPTEVDRALYHQIMYAIA